MIAVRTLVVASVVLASAACTPSLELTRTLEGHASPVGALSIRGERLVSCGGDGTARLWDVSGKLSWTVRPDPAATGSGVALLDSDASDSRIAVPNDRSAVLWPDGKLVALSFGPLDAAATEPRPGGVCFLEVTSREARGVFRGEVSFGEVTCLAWSPDGNLVAGWRDGAVRVLDPRGRLVRELEHPLHDDPHEFSGVVALDVSPNGKVAVVVWSPRVAGFCEYRLHDERGKLVWTVPGYGHPAWRRCSSCGWVGVAGPTGHCVGARMEPLPGIGDPLATEQAPERPLVRAVTFSPDGQRLAFAGWICTGTTKKVEGGLAGLLGFVESEKRGRVWLVSARDGRTEKIIDGEVDGPIESVAFSPSGDRLALGAFEHHFVWSIGEGRLLGRREVPLGMAYFPEGTVTRRMLPSVTHSPAVVFLDEQSLAASSGNRVEILRVPGR
jgi:WD40 repeat protein